MPGAALRTRVPRVLRAVIPYGDPRWGECGFQSRLDTGQPGFTHAGQLAGMLSSRVWAAIQNAWAMKNTNVSPSVP